MTLQRFIPSGWEPVCCEHAHWSMQRSKNHAQALNGCRVSTFARLLTCIAQRGCRRQLDSGAQSRWAALLGRLCRAAGRELETHLLFLRDVPPTIAAAVSGCGRARIKVSYRRASAFSALLTHLDGFVSSPAGRVPTTHCRSRRSPGQFPRADTDFDDDDYAGVPRSRRRQ